MLTVLHLNEHNELHSAYSFFFTALAVFLISVFIAFSLHKKQQKRKISPYYLRWLLAFVVAGTGIWAIYFLSMYPFSFSDAVPYPLAFTAVSALPVILAACCAFYLIVVLGRSINFRTSYYDPMTKLPNRRLFEETLKTQSKGSIAIWHLHQIEKINRDYGYSFGDDVIRAVAALLAENKPGGARLYRIKGNRFAFLLEKDTVLDELQQAMENIALQWKNPFFVGETEVVLKTACSLASVDKTDPPGKLLASATAVLEHPAVRFEHEVITYDPAVHTQPLEQEIVDAIDQAMENNELFVMYQPKIFADTNELTGFEALIRWRHPDHGLLSPSVFIPILERNHRIDDVTDWLVKEVCRQISEWHNLQYSVWNVSINIPGEYVTSPRLLEVLTATTQKYGVDPKQLELEITETSLVGSAEAAIRSIQTFRTKGFSVALDDFGTGVSSLSYLRQMPISSLKIDKSFVDRVPHSEKDASILHAIITLGQSLDLNIVIEGVERLEQVHFLMTKARHLTIQGYYYAKPMTADELTG